MVEQAVAELMGGILSRSPEDMTMSFALTPQSGVEPMDIAKLAIACEARWGLTLHDERVAEWRRLRDVAAHINELLEDGQAEPLERSDEDRLAWYYE